MDKFNRASNRAFCDYAFYAGGTEDNADNLPSYEKINGCCGVKVFMGASTGSLLVAKEEDLDKIVSKINYRASFHCEDQSRLLEREKFQEEGKVHTHEIWRDKLSSLIATQKLVSIAEKYNKKVHVLHVTTEEEINFLSEHKKNVSVEITPQHLTLHSPDCYDRLGSYAQMNPPIRSKKHQDRLWEAINEGIADIIGSDHAPHTKEEKNKNYPLSPSGMPGVQTLVPVMLNHVAKGKLSLERFIELTSYNPSVLFGIKNKGRIEIGCDADFTVIDLSMKKKITNDWIASKCGWTPYEGMSIKGWPVMTIIRGHLVMNEGKIIDPIGKPMSFER
jgi:dihydroorotase